MSGEKKGNTMKKNKCLFCDSTECFTRVFLVDDLLLRKKLKMMNLLDAAYIAHNKNKYDEIACRKHVNILVKHSKKILGKGWLYARAFSCTSSLSRVNN